LEDTDHRVDVNPILGILYQSILRPIVTKYISHYMN